MRTNVFDDYTRAELLDHIADLQESVHELQAEVRRLKVDPAQIREEVSTEPGASCSCVEVKKCLRDGCAKCCYCGATIPGTDPFDDTRHIQNQSARPHGSKRAL